MTIFDQRGQQVTYQYNAASEINLSGNVSSEGDIHARDIITGIQNDFTVIFQQPFVPPSDLIQLRVDYLAYLHDSYRYLDMKGIMQVQQVTQQLPLAAIYVPLKAYAHQTGPSKMIGRVAGRLFHLAGETEVEPDLSAAMLSRSVEPQLIEEILKGEPVVVVLGDPGAGKSTLLKVIALALTDQDDGPLPIILPLNAYARRLQQGEIHLARFLGEYYATRQRKLKRIDELFETALNYNQAVVLLDGLDEVQADRAYLVRLVQDFVAEYMPQPYQTAEVFADEHRPTSAVSKSEETPVAAGNRIVVTSRIVGYNDAPLAGEQWHHHTLTDFNREDIERFISQWTLLFAISVRGDSEPTRRAAERERWDLIEAIFSRPSVERLATNPLMLTILALIKYTGVTLPEQRVNLYELYLQALIESWNRARSLDQYPVGPGMNYVETVQVLASLALWLRQENPTAGLVSREQIEQWLTAYYHGEEWGLPKGEARQRGRDFIDNVERYSNLLLERGERQYGFLHLTLEEMLAAKGIVQLANEDKEAALTIFKRYLLEPGWHETLQLAVGVMGVLQQRPKSAGTILQHLLQLKVPADVSGHQVIFAGNALLDLGTTNVGRPASQRVTIALAETMQSIVCSIHTRRDAGNLLGRLGWTPEPEIEDLLLTPPGVEPTGLDAFRLINMPSGPTWLSKYPVTNYQYARFIEDGGYDYREFWSEDGWAWRVGAYDSQAPEKLRPWLELRYPEMRSYPYWWQDRKWNSPLYPIVGISWFEADAYCCWLTTRMGNRQTANERIKKSTNEIEREMWQGLATGKLMVRLPLEAEWETAMKTQGDYPWGNMFDFSHLNCADSWAKRDLSDKEQWSQWHKFEAFREAGLTAVTTYPQGVSLTGVWDSSGNIWEWMGNQAIEEQILLRGGSWLENRNNASVSSMKSAYPDEFSNEIGFRVIIATSY